jgi:hypothetical protein
LIAVSSLHPDQGLFLSPVYDIPFLVLFICFFVQTQYHISCNELEHRVIIHVL